MVMNFIESHDLLSKQVTYYVDPSIAADSGSGTIGSPYGDLQYALNQVGTSPGRNTTTGDRFYIKGGTDEVLTAPLSLATYGIPAAGAGLTFEGYGTTPGDRGQAGISGNVTHTILDASLSASYQQIIFRNLHLHNCGANAQVLRLPGNYSSVVNCEIDKCDGIGINSRSLGQAIVGNRLYDLGGVGAIVNNAGSTSEEQMFVAYNYYNQQGSRSTSSAVILVGRFSVVYRNILSLGIGETGIKCNGPTYRMRIRSNSILCQGAGTGQGIAGNQGALSGSSLSISGNLIEGFSGTGGDGIEVSELGGIFDFSHNAVFNCTNPYLGVVNIPVYYIDNETLTGSPFAKGGANTYANRFNYFAPANEGNVLGGYHAWDKGAVQTPSVVATHNWDHYPPPKSLLIR